MTFEPDPVKPPSLVFGTDPEWFAVLDTGGMTIALFFYEEDAIDFTKPGWAIVRVKRTP